MVDERDQKFYEENGLSLPSLCPDERQLRRMSWRNERNFYHRKCDACGKQIISIYHADSSYTVYCNDCWWSDKWNALDFGLDVDLGKSFFEQMHELQLKVPRLALYQKNSQNSDYTNHSENNKDCYMTVDTARGQDIFYSKWMINCQDCVDCYNIEDCQLCYEDQYQVTGFRNIYNFFSDFSTESAFLYGCTNCTSCFMCSNLQRKEYCVRNEQMTREQYAEFMGEIDLGSYEVLMGFLREYKEMIKNAPKRAGLLIMCEDCEGDCMMKCKNVLDSFDVIESRDCRYCYEAGHMNDCYDVYESAFECERQYECHGCNRGKFLKFASVSYDMNSSDYVDICHNSHDLFGCVGLRHKKFCVLNKQYSEEEYEELRAKLIEHMGDEWGEFFPARFSPFAYNETIAQEYYPLSQEQAEARGYGWKEENEDQGFQGEAYELPDHVKDTPNDVCEKILKCEQTGKFYKIVPRELAIYRKLGVALPRTCLDQRYLDRLALRNYRRLWDWQCTKCSKDIRAPYVPGSGQTVYCQECFRDLKYA